METETFSVEKQQRLLLRGISNIRSLAAQAFKTGLIQDFANLEAASRDFKVFVQERVTAPEIRDFSAQIPKIRHGSSEPGLFRILFMPFVSLFSGRSVRAKQYTIHDARAVQAQYGSLEILVGMMDED